MQYSKEKNRTGILVESAVLVALSTVLSLIKLVYMPLGGAVTLACMLPVGLVSVRHGCKWGFASSFVFALIQFLLGIMGGLLGWGLNVPMLLGCMMLDYLLPYSLCGLFGAFRKKGEAGIYCGVTLACVLRFLSHFLSGFIIFSYLSQWDLWGKTFEGAPLLYSACYNGLYMLPELFLTIVVTVILFRIPYCRKNVFLLPLKQNFSASDK